MESVTDEHPLVVIVGQTASGKSALAYDLARCFSGEIIAADSRTVYRGMDIGTAKPSKEERQLIPHHLVDVVDPTTSFTVSDFKDLAVKAIADISARAKLPILVGGTGLYVDAVIYDFGFRVAPDAALRKKLEQLSVGELQSQLFERGIDLPNNAQNPRHLIRALETGGEVSVRKPLRKHTLVIGIEIEADRLKQRIVSRVDQMVENGLVDEVRTLSAKYGWDAPAFLAPGYRAFRPYLENTITLDEAKRQFVQNDMQYAKRQKTWFKRNKSINWISKPEDAVDLVTTLLNK